MRTVIVHKIRNTDAKKRGVQAGVETGEALSLHNPACRVIGGRVRSFRFDLSTSRQGDERVTGDEELDRRNHAGGVD